MGAIVPRSYPKYSLRKKRKPNAVQCQAIVEDYKNGTGYNLRRYIVTPDSRLCQRNAVSKLGKFCFCKQHTKLALEGLIDEGGQVAPRADLRAVRDNPQQHPDGLYSWARDLKPVEIK